MLARLEILVGGGVVGVGDGAHVGGQVGALAAHAGDDDHRGIGEVLRVRNQRIAVRIGRRLRQGPVLRPHAHLGAVCTVGRVEVAQLGVQRKARVGQAVKQAHGRVRIGKRAGARAAVAGVRGGPAEHVQLGAGAQRQGAVVIQQHDAFLANLLAEGVGLDGGFFRHGAVAGGKADEGAHGPEADPVDDDGNDGQNGHDRLLACQITFCLGFDLAAGDHAYDKRGQCDAQPDELDFEAVHGVDDVIHVQAQRVCARRHRHKQRCAGDQRRQSADLLVHLRSPPVFFQTKAFASGASPPSALLERV